ncbi:helix-turn-helix domain-containing protein [Algihabitans sp.]|uniref:AlbA family DNA-binding domain-containing protein n=1 Tax=Algihabitans sp. TaxID=2821514 RepID=UPI003BA85EF3
MAGPEWIDETLSAELPLLRDRGEGQHLEFMERYPDNGHELSREIAAFASSNPGNILIGVADDGSLAGLEDVDTAEGRDRLCRRIEGVCSGNVRPAITPVIKFAKEDEAVVLAIEVPRGGQPVYYSRNTPYVRHLSRSRPAEPHEVIERVGEWLARNPLAPAADEAGSRFLSNLAATLIEVLIYGGELEQRNVNPWLDLVRTQLGRAGQELRRLASEDSAVEKGLDDRLRSIAEKLDAAASHRLVMGGDSWKTLAGYVSDAIAEASRLKAEHIDSVPLADQARRDSNDMIRRSARELSDLDRRAEAIASDGRVEELQEEASRIGQLLLTTSHYQIPEHDEDFVAQLREIGTGLHLIETQRLYMDGGQSMRRIVGRVHDLNTKLQTLLSVD